MKKYSKKKERKIKLKMFIKCNKLFNCIFISFIFLHWCNGVQRQESLYVNKSHC